jgi:hypothetical protein
MNIGASWYLIYSMAVFHQLPADCRAFFTLYSDQQQLTSQSLSFLFIFF